MSKVRRKRTSAEDQYRNIMECRASGLSDHQWCKVHEIEPSTFYNWIRRLRQKGTYEIPEPCRAGEFAPAPVQDVVKLDIFPEDTFALSSAKHPMQKDVIPTIEISLGNTTIRISNNADPHLLAHVIRSLGGAAC